MFCFLTMYLIRNPPPPNTIVSEPIDENTSFSGAAVRTTSSSINAHPSQQFRSKSMTSCNHHSHGQELCRVCHQRAKRNIPVYLHEEKRAREAEESKLLEQYQHDREVEEHKKREVNNPKKFFTLNYILFIFPLGCDESNSRRKTKNSCCMDYLLIDKSLEFLSFFLVQYGYC